MLDNALKKSMATLLCHILKMDNKELSIGRDIFLDFMEENFDNIDIGELQRLFDKLIKQKYDNIDKHLSIISNALYNKQYIKMKLLNQLNSIILKSSKGEISDEDYEFFEKVKTKLFHKE